MTTLLTGATGFVGAAVLRCLIAAGHNVRALVRPNSDRRNLSGVDCEIVTGDLTEPESLGAVRDCETVLTSPPTIVFGFLTERENEPGQCQVTVDGSGLRQRAQVATSTHHVATLRPYDGSR